MDRQEILDKLKGEAWKDTLDELAGEFDGPSRSSDVNNHIHTTYSFSPYSPSAAAYFARKAGLCTCGLIDHDSIGGWSEFLYAAQKLRIGATIGIEMRVRFPNTPFERVRINNPDQNGIAYILIHGVPHSKAAELNEYMAPYRERRNVRNRKMTEGINSLMGKYGVTVDFDRDVLPISNYAKGGTVTERHLSAALSSRMLEVIGPGEKLVKFMRDEMGQDVPAKIEKYICDEDNPHMMYDLLGLIKSGLISRFYLPATDECMTAKEAVELANRLGAIPAYSYLGDVGDSVTGDKRAQAFEDAYLDELIAYVKELGFTALTYAPTRNTPAQIARIDALIDRYGFMPISGEDINSPRQSFVCEAQRGDMFRLLYDSAWALIEHEYRMDFDGAEGIFGAAAVKREPDLKKRIAAFALEARGRLNG